MVKKGRTARMGCPSINIRKVETRFYIRLRSDETPIPELEVEDHLPHNLPPFPG
jgi:hypothetical protein